MTSGGSPATGERTAKYPAAEGTADCAHPAPGTKAWFARPPRVWQLVGLAIVCALVAYGASFPGGMKQMVLGGSELRLFLVACAIWPGGVVLLGLDYMVRLGVCIHRRCLALSNWRWGTAGILLAASIVAWSTDWLLCWRFAANRPALEGTVAVLLETTTSSPEPGCDLDWPFAAFVLYGAQVGDYEVQEVAVFPTEKVVFLRTGGVFRSGWGFLYDPHGHVSGVLMQPGHVEGPWFTFAYDKE